MMTSEHHDDPEEHGEQWSRTSVLEAQNEQRSTCESTVLEEHDQQQQEDMEVRCFGSQENCSIGHESGVNDSNSQKAGGNGFSRHEANMNDFSLQESSGKDYESNMNGYDVHESSGNDFNGHESSGTDSNGSGSKMRSGCTFRRPSQSTGGRSSNNSSNNSEPSDRIRSHKELAIMVQEMKRRLPPEKVKRSKPSTVDALNYALNCVRQVQANSQFFRVLGEKTSSRIHLEAHTIEELENITSEHSTKNTDTFVVVFSLTSGRTLYISEHATTVLGCKKDVLDSLRFVELLAPQDVHVFYKHTAQSHLLPWNMGTDTASSLYQYTQVKSFFCRIRGGKDGDRELRYFPFRITPYSVLVCSTVSSEVESCCLALAERIHSGYEAPRIPLDKWIFTTKHTPGCGFLEVDDRAVPLLGYLPQDLIGTSVLMHLHSEDRPLMLAIHRKILRFAGQQPFDHAPIRFCTKNGDYVTLDTSWSSFVNPWSRKVSFIIGRHKVRTGPLNEDVFAPRSREFNNNANEIRELQGKIYKLLLQPVHNNGSSGYGSFGSNGSYEHYISIASSSDSNGNCVEDMQREPMTLQQVCVDVNRIKNLGQQVYIESRSRRQGKKSESLHNKIQKAITLPAAEGQTTSSCDASRKGQPVPSYQQINCVDSIIRYLESYTIPARKRKTISSIHTSSSSSQERRRVQRGRRGSKALDDASRAPTPASQGQLAAESVVGTDGCAASPVVGPPLTNLTLSIKAMSVVSATSPCSYSSTIVHVPQPESEVTAIEDVTIGSEASIIAPEEFKQVGLTKEILSAHTQKEEKQYVDRFRLRILQSPYSSYLQQGSQSKGCSHDLGAKSSKQAKKTTGKKSKNQGKREKHKRQNPQESSDSNGSNQNRQPCVKKMGSVQQSWPSSEVPQLTPSNSAFPQPVIPNPPTNPVPGFPIPSVTTVSRDCTISSIGQETLPHSNLSYAVPSYQTFPSPYIGPFMAVMLPNCPVYAQIVQQIPQPYFASPYTCSSSYSLSTVPVPPPGIPSHVTPDTLDPPSQVSSPDTMDPSSQVSSPMSAEGQQEVSGNEPPLFSNSRSSSPLQLDLLQEELPKSMEPQEVAEDEKHVEMKFADAAEDSGNNDSHSASSGLLDLLLQEDCQSGTGSSGSGSGSGSTECSFLGSSSNVCSSNGTSGSGPESRNSSKYFTSNDSSNTSQNRRNRLPGFFHGAAQDPMWTLIKDTSAAILMTYQLPTSYSKDLSGAGLPFHRDKDALLKEDLKKLIAMQNMQPCFTEGQKQELAEVHPWIRTRTIPHVINVQGCIICDRNRVECPTVNTCTAEDHNTTVSQTLPPPCGLQEHKHMESSET